MSTTNNFKIAQRERQMIIIPDKFNKRIYLNDSFDPARVLCIATSSSEEFKQTAVNTRCIKFFELSNAKESGLFAELKQKTYQ